MARSHNFTVIYYSQLPLNGHLVKVATSLKQTRGIQLVPAVLQSFTSSPSKADTSLKRIHGAGPCHTSVIYFISLQGGHLSKADSQSWSQACPPLRKLTVLILCNSVVSRGIWHKYSKLYFIFVHNVMTLKQQVIFGKF